ncbi:MAG: hypothetical protein ACKPEZ_28475, partial [Planktothrix sp.]
SVARDRTMKVWDLHSGSTVAGFSGDGELLSCAVAPDDVTVVVGEASGRLHFLRLENWLSCTYGYKQGLYKKTS